MRQLATRALAAGLMVTLLGVGIGSVLLPRDRKLRRRGKAHSQSWKLSATAAALHMTNSEDRLERRRLSLCPKCQVRGWFLGKVAGHRRTRAYRCPACRHTWHVSLPPSQRRDVPSGSLRGIMAAVLHPFW